MVNGLFMLRQAQLVASVVSVRPARRRVLMAYRCSGEPEPERWLTPGTAGMGAATHAPTVSVRSMSPIRRFQNLPCRGGEGSDTPSSHRRAELHR